MRHIIAWLRVFGVDEEGPTAVEYAVTLALIIGVCVSAVSALGTSANQKFQEASATLAAPTPPPAPARGD